MDYASVVSQAMMELMQKDKEERYKVVNMGKGSSTEDLVPNQAPVPWATMSAAPGFWVPGPSDQVARKGPANSLRARGKVPARQVELPPPAEID